MPIRFLSEEEWVPYHRQVLVALTALGQSTKGVRTHSAGLEFTSLMFCFLMHNVAAARSLLTLCGSSGAEWFPVTIGYGIARSMFEIDVTAHYIARSPKERARQYILFEHVLNKKAMEACKKHRKSANCSWRESTETEWHARWEEREEDINKRFSEVASLFTKRDGRLFSNWSGQAIRQLAVEVDHEEAYDHFYAALSSFSHADVLLANRFLRVGPEGCSWTQRANPFDAGEVLHDAAAFLTCYLKLFGSEFVVWDDAAVDACWSAGGKPS